MEIIRDGKGFAKVWARDLEDGAVEQIRNLLRLPFLHKWLAAMPDCHQGYGMPIGGVAALDGMVSPNMVGVDIGCGMCALRTNLTEITLEQLKAIMGKTRERVPVGFAKHQMPQSGAFMPQGGTSRVPFRGVVEQHYDAAHHQVGTLGGGNHFIEIQKGSDGHIWIMIHSGSRNLGKQVADHYNKLAVQLNARWHSSVPREHDLAFLPLDSPEGQAYMAEMQYCVEFAFANRKLMMGRIAEAFCDSLPYTGQPIFTDWEASLINIAHNYAAMENHYGKNVMVHRKGATRAREGEIGIIPGSQGSHSYIVEGLGNPESFQSCSHGAGRKMGRKEACRSLDLKAQQKLLDDQGIIHSVNKVEDLDEAPGAYKDISQVMADQIDLVKTVVELTPLAVVKG